MLENDAEYDRWAIARRNVTRVTRDDKARLELQQLLEGMRDSALAQTGPVKSEVAAAAEPQTLAQSDPAQTVDPASASPAPAQTTPTDLNWVPTPSGNPGNGGGGGGGGGAIDPVTGLLAAGLAASAIYKRKRRPSIAPSDVANKS